MDLEEQIRAGMTKMMQSIVMGMTPFVATVESVDESAMTCVLKSLSGSEYPTVRLKTSPDNKTHGVIAIPVVGSFVIAARLSNKNDVFVLMVDKVSKYVINCSDDGVIELNGNTYKMARPDKIAERLKRLEDAFSAFQTVYNSHTHIAAGVATAFPVPLSSGSLAPSTNEDYISHDKVKHG